MVINGNKKLVFRADASPQIGIGHVMRCLALAQAWNSQSGKTTFVMTGQSSALEARLRSEEINIVYLSAKAASNEDAQQTANIAQKLAVSWAVVDGYHFGSEYQKRLKSYGLNVLLVDDYGHSEHYYADFILNQNISANADLYINRESYTHLLLGTKYTLLRQEFLLWRDWRREIAPIASKILITLGGSDPDNVTLKVIQALERLNRNNLEVIVVIGGSNPHYQVLQKEIADSSLAISLQRNVSNMPELMAWADLTIAAGGSTNWELAFMGLPSLVITIADNQKAIAAELNRQGVILNLGWHQDLTLEHISMALQKMISDRPKRQIMSKKGRELIDGIGSKRVIDAIMNIK
jgi:UDP-2,4-diacetamido-2,4,6-trideoxy-beta-L-altropyranose hydrolase